MRQSLISLGIGHAEEMLIAGDTVTTPISSKIASASISVAELSEAGI